jgi:hypothetical protein
LSLISSSWAYFKPIIEQERARLCESCGVNARAAGGQLRRCLDCRRADVDAERREREARMARSHRPATEWSKACRSCKVIKPVIAFYRHARSKDGHRHDCRDCANARRSSQPQRADKVVREPTEQSG